MNRFVAFVVALSTVVALSAQTFRGAVTTVEIPVTVTDNTGRLIMGLTKDDFEVYEDGDSQPVTFFSDKRTPVSVGLLLDVLTWQPSSAKVRSGMGRRERSTGPTFIPAGCSTTILPPR